jgi:hypothetical protein
MSVMNRTRRIGTMSSARQVGGVGT